MKDDQKNFVIFAVFAALVLLLSYTVLPRFLPQSAQPAQTQTPAGPTQAGQTASAPTAGTSAPAESHAATKSLAQALAEGPRIPIETPTLKGSINLKGARIDDLVLNQYRETVAKNSPPVRLLAPAGAPDAYFAGFGWSDTGLKPPAPDTVWKATGDVLAPGKPVTLDAANGQGQRFRIEISVDDGYMFTVKQTVANDGTAPVAVQPYALISRGASTDTSIWTNHVGPVSVHDDAADYGVDYKTLATGPQKFTTAGGWLGFADKYWLTALVPDQSSPIAAEFRAGNNQTFQGDYLAPAKPLGAGQQVTYSSRFYAGAKEVARLDHYQTLGVPKFENAVDWGWFQIIERPIFVYLDWLFHLVGNFGVAIILLTITIRALLFPIAQRQFASMANMRVIQPKMKALQERYKDDKPRQQQEIMKLYKEEKVNPLAGCLPVLLQIPIMFALYKVLLLSTEMRHQPFVLWIKDLSVPDPATILNLFGLLHFTPTSFFAIGIVPVLLGVSMFFQMKLNPAPMDEMQKQVFAIMPWMLMFVMAPFAVGLQLYWITSNCITILQQRWLYSRHPALKQKPVK